jgi:hypothetical protein
MSLQDASCDGKVTSDTSVTLPHGPTLAHEAVDPGELFGRLLDPKALISVIICLLFR